MTLEDLLAEISALGWRLNNLFEHDDGTWQANARSATLACDFGRGDTPAEALEACIDRIHTGCVGPLYVPPLGTAVDISAILRPPPTPFIRRKL